MNGRICYQTLRRQLEHAELEDAAYTARLILEACTGLSFPALLIQSEAALTQEQQARIQNMTKRRMEGYPIQYLLEHWNFYGLELTVGEGVLIPRQDTETLVDFVLACRKDAKHTRLLDLCSGTGCIPLAVAANLSYVTAVAIEYSPAALAYLQQNIQRYPYDIKPVAADVTDSALAASYHNFDVITCNPPYLTQQDMQLLQKEVTFEPASALYGGSDGLDYYRRISALWQTALVPGGWLVYEIGQGQAPDVATLLHQTGFTNITMKQDLSGIVRLVAGRRPISQ